MNTDKIETIKTAMVAQLKKVVSPEEEGSFFQHEMKDDEGRTYLSYSVNLSETEANTFSLAQLELYSLVREALGNQWFVKCFLEHEDGNITAYVTALELPDVRVMTTI